MPRQTLGTPDSHYTASEEGLLSRCCQIPSSSFFFFFFFLTQLSFCCFIKKNATYLVSLTLSFFFKFFSFPGASTLNGWVVLRKCSSPLLLLEALPLCLSASFCVSRLLAVRAATAWRQTGAFPETRARATLWLPQTHLGVFTYSFTNRARLLCKTGPATFKIWPPSRGNQLFSAPESSHNSLCI